jgi:hypothetical protein
MNVLDNHNDKLFLKLLDQLLILVNYDQNIA